MDTSTDVFVKQTFSGVPLVRIQDEQIDSFQPISVSEENVILARSQHRVQIYDLDRPSSSFTNSSIGAPQSTYGFGMSGTDADFYRYDVLDSTDCQFFPTTLITTKHIGEIQANYSMESLETLLQSLTSPGSLDTSIVARTRADLDVKFLTDKHAKVKDCSGVFQSSIQNGIEISHTIDHTGTIPERSMARVENGKEYWTQKFWSFDGITSVVTAYPHFSIAEWGPVVSTYGRILLTGIQGSLDNVSILCQSRNTDIDVFKPQLLANMKMYILVLFQRMYRCTLEAALAADMLQDNSMTAVLRDMQIQPQVYQQLSMVNVGKFSPPMKHIDRSEYSILILGTGGLLVFFTMPLSASYATDTIKHTSSQQGETNITITNNIVKEQGACLFYGNSGMCLDNIENIASIHNIPGQKYAGSVLQYNIMENKDLSVCSDAVAEELQKDQGNTMQQLDYTCTGLDVSIHQEDVILTVSTGNGHASVLKLALPYSNKVQLSQLYTSSQIHALYRPLSSLSFVNILTHTKLVTLATKVYAAFTQQEKCYLVCMDDLSQSVFIYTHSNIKSMTSYLDTLLCSHTDGTTSRYTCELLQNTVQITSSPVLRHDSKTSFIVPNVITDISSVSIDQISQIRQLHGSGDLARLVTTLQRQYCVYTVEGNLVQWSGAFLHEDDDMVHNDWYTVNNNILVMENEYKEQNQNKLTSDTSARKIQSSWLLHLDILTRANTDIPVYPQVLLEARTMMSEDLYIVLQYLYSSIVTMKQQYIVQGQLYHVPLHRALNQLVATVLVEYTIFLENTKSTELLGFKYKQKQPKGQFMLPNLSMIDETVLTRVNIKIAVLFVLTIMAYTQTYLSIQYDKHPKNATSNQGLFQYSPILDTIQSEVQQGLSLKTMYIRQDCAYLRALTAFAMSTLHPDQFTGATLKVEPCSVQPKQSKGLVTSTAIAIDSVKTKLDAAKGVTKAFDVSILNYIAKVTKTCPKNLVYSLYSDTAIPECTLVTSLKVYLVALQTLTTTIGDVYMTAHTLHPDARIFNGDVQYHPLVPVQDVSLITSIPLLQACDRTLFTAINAWTMVQNTVATYKLSKDDLLHSYYMHNVALVQNASNANKSFQTQMQDIPRLLNATVTAFQAVAYTALLKYLSEQYNTLSLLPSLQYLGMYKYHYIHDSSFQVEQQALSQMQALLHIYASKYASSTISSNTSTKHGFHGLLHALPILHMARFITVAETIPSVYYQGSTTLSDIQTYITHYTIPNTNTGLQLIPDKQYPDKYTVQPSTTPLCTISKCDEYNLTFDHAHTIFAIQTYPFHKKQLQCTCCKKYITTTVQTSVDNIHHARPESSSLKQLYHTLCNASTTCPYCLAPTK